MTLLKVLIESLSTHFAVFQRFWWKFVYAMAGMLHRDCCISPFENVKRPLVYQTRD